MLQSLHPAKCIRLWGPAGMLTRATDPPSGRSWKGSNSNCQMPQNIFIWTSAPGSHWRPETGRSPLLRLFTVSTRPTATALQPSPYWSSTRSSLRGQPSEPNGCKDPPDLSGCLISACIIPPQTTQPLHPLAALVETICFPVLEREW